MPLTRRTLLLAASALIAAPVALTSAEDEIAAHLRLMAARIARLKAGGTWDKLGHLWVFDAPTAALAAVDWRKAA